MKRWIVVGLLGFVLTGVLALAAHAGMGRGPVYTVAAVEMNLQRDPGRWVGRTVLVQGRMIMHHRWLTSNDLLLEADLADPRVWYGGELPLAPGPEDPFLAFLRRLPLVGAAAPPRQALPRDAVAIVRVQLRAVRDDAGTIGYEAVLLDAAPDSP